MTRFASYDGTMLAYSVLPSGGAAGGRVLACLPGGPGRNPVYLGDLGGLGPAAGRDLVMAEPRGIGDSDPPEDTATYRCDRQVDDVEALRRHLGLDQMDLLAHSAGANLALLYAARYPDRIGRLVLLTPSLRAVGLMMAPGEEREAVLRRRSAEPWYPEALAAFRAAEAGRDSVENLKKYSPFYYGRWDEAAQAHAVLGMEPRGARFGARYYSAGAFDPDATRAALAKLEAPVLVYAGELDIIPTPELAAEAVRLFPYGELVIQPGAGHMPWLDDPGWLAAAIARFLG